MQSQARKRQDAGAADAVAGGLAQDPLRRERSDGIDVLRAIFALWVVLAHLVPWSVMAQGPAAVPGWLAAGARLVERVFQPIGELHPAVVAFIVLSGYCIHRAGLRAPAFGQIAGYAIRRFFRIVPLYYLAIAAGLAGFVLAARVSPRLANALSGTDAISGGCIAAKALVLSAFWPGWHQCGFLGNAPLATVLVEIVLYVLYGAAFAGLVWRGREHVVWLAWGGLLLASLAMLAAGVGPNFYAWWQNGSLFGFLPYWWLGVLFAKPGFAAAWTRRWPLVAAGWIGLTAVLLLAPPPAVQAVAELRKLCFALGVGVLIAAVDAARVETARMRPIGALAPLGRAGYGLYAMHAPLTYTLLICGLAWWGVLAADLLAGLLVHRAVERPLIDLGRALRGRLAPRPTGRPARALH